MLVPGNLYRLLHRSGFSTSDTDRSESVVHLDEDNLLLYVGKAPPPPGFADWFRPDRPLTAWYFLVDGALLFCHVFSDRAHDCGPDTLELRRHDRAGLRGRGRA